jgi:hypothetical protein
VKTPVVALLRALRDGALFRSQGGALYVKTASTDRERKQVCVVNLADGVAEWHGELNAVVEVRLPCFPG